MTTNTKATFPENRQGNVCCESLVKAVTIVHGECLKELLLKSGADVKSGADANSGADVKSGAYVGSLADVKSSSEVEELPFETVKQAQHKCAKRLAEAGADVNLQDNDGYIALIIVAEDGHYKWGDLLLKAGADVNI